MKCGRNHGEGSDAREHACPTFSEIRLDGIHGGRNAGRACWVVAGTMCGGDTQGLFASKLGKCVMCDFYKMVRLEEKENFRSPSQLIDVILSDRIDT